MRESRYIYLLLNVSVIFKVYGVLEFWGEFRELVLINRENSMEGRYENFRVYKGNLYS